MLDFELNKAILSLAPKYSVSMSAPETFEALKSASTSTLVIYAGGSEDTVYGEATVNHAFRAWHDDLHLKLNAPFTREGETLVAMEQARILGQRSIVWSEIMLAEVVGQINYLEQHGDFPSDQVSFVRKLLKGVL